MTRSAPASASASDSPSSRSAPWCTCTRRSGVNRAASRCQLPTSDIGHTSSVGLAPALAGDQRQQLDRLAQAHVVGEDAAEPELAQEGQPGEPALLVRPQLTGEASGRGHRPQPPVGLTGQQVAQPAVGVHPDQRDLLVRPPGPPSPRPSPAVSASAAVIVPAWLRSRNFSAAFRCASSSSTHWPRSRTSGTFSRASSASSSGSSASSPTATSYRKSTRSPRPNRATPAPADEPAVLRDRVVSFSPSLALRTQSGSSTPNPAPASSGPVSLRNRNAPAVSISTRAGAASRSASSSSPNSRAGRAQAGQQLLHRVAAGGHPRPPAGPDQTSAAETIRLGSSADCSANSTRQGSESWLAGSASRKQVRTGPAGITALSRHASSSAASPAVSASSCGVTTSRRASVVVRASTNRSATGRRAGVRPRRGGSSEAGSRARAAASARASRTLPSSVPGACPETARQDGGMAAARSRARCASAPPSTGRHRAAYAAPSASSTGSTRPRAARLAAKRATAAR